MIARGRPNVNSPTPVLEISEAVEIAAGEYHALAVTRKGTAYAWGYGTMGQLGLGSMPVINFKGRRLELEQHQ